MSEETKKVLKPKKIMHFKEELLTNENIAVACTTEEECKALHNWAVAMETGWYFNPWNIYKEESHLLIAKKRYMNTETVEKLGLDIREYKDVKTKKQIVEKRNKVEKFIDENEDFVVELAEGNSEQDQDGHWHLKEDKEDDLLDAMAVIKKQNKFFLEDHVPAEQIKWLNFKRGILEDKAKKRVKTNKKGKKRDRTPEAKIAWKEYQKVVELIKNVRLGEEIPKEQHEYVESCYKEFSNSIMPDRHIPNNSYEGPITKESGKTVKPKKKKKIREMLESGDVLEIGAPILDPWGNEVK